MTRSSRKSAPLSRSKPPVVEWMEKNDLIGWQPTCELRINEECCEPGEGILEQKWIRSEMQYGVKWMPIRIKRSDEK